MAAGDPGVLKRNFSAVAIETTLTNAISSASTNDVTTSVTVVSTSGFPSVPFTLIIGQDTSKEEVVTCTAIVGTSLTIVRGQDGTPAVAHTAGSSVRHGVSGRDFKEEQTHQAARGYDSDSGILSNVGVTHVHGLIAGDGDIVGTSKTQTLSNKTLGGNLAAGGYKITGLGTPTTGTDAATKTYVDSNIGSAAISAASAATSASSAAATYTAYDARYLGSKATAPTVDNLGGTLLVGATYWNTATNTMYAWSGSVWNAISTTGYFAPTLGSTVLTSGATITTVAGLTLTTATIGGNISSATGTYAQGGRATFGSSTIDNTAHLTTFTTNATRIGMAVIGAASQSADLIQVLNSGGTKLSGIAANGGLVTYDVNGYQQDTNLMHIMGAW